MSDHTEDQITRNVLESMSQAPDPRLHTVMQSFITHLHAFLREVRPSEQEWFQAIQFLTRTGQICDDRRQEFILLSDITGTSMLVDAINHHSDEGQTESTIFGPFYREGARELPLGASINLDGQGEPAIVSGYVRSLAGAPIASALLDVWETNENGLYEQQDANQSDFNLRGKFRTNADGYFCFVGIKPVSYPIPDDGPVGQLLRAVGRHPYRPAHIHMVVSAESFVPVTTHLFVAGDRYLESDAVFGTRDSLIVDFIKNDDPAVAARYAIPIPYYTATYDFILKPEAN